MSSSRLGISTALASALADARARGRRVTLRGAGLSFDAHALGGDLALSLDAFDEIALDVGRRQVTVGAGARWRDILQTVSREGLAPYVVVTTGGATAGGTLSVNCHSRFSPLWGKEGRHVESLELLTADGTLHHCSRTENPELFFGAIGGFGMVGVVVRATYRLRRVGAPIRVETWVTRQPDLRDLARLALPPDAAPGGDPEDRPTTFALLAVNGTEARVMMSSARMVAEKKLAPMVPHQPSSPMRVPVEWLIHWVPRFSTAFWDFAYDHYVRESRPYVDALAPHTFMMDGHARARRAAAALGLPFRTLQVTWIVPASQSAPEPLKAFLEEALRRFSNSRCRPGLADVLWLPRDEPFGFSSTRASGGYAVTFAFDSPEPARMGALNQLLEGLNDLCLDLGGRLHLGKNVVAPPQQIERMYAAAADELFALKARWDPQGTLANDLVDRIFPERVRRG